MTYNQVTYPKEKILNLLKNGFFTVLEKDILIALYSFENCKATAPQLANILGYSHFAPINLVVGKLGKKIARELGLELRRRENGTYSGWDIIFEGQDRKEGFLWTLKSPIREALSVLDTEQISINSNIPEEIPSNIDLIEGAKKQITVNNYERNKSARDLCLLKYKPICAICGFNFQEKYGDLGKGYIHVHHITPLYEIDKEYRVNPETDLIPICPNCHAMIHKDRKKALTIDELKNIVNNRCQ